MLTSETELMQATGPYLIVAIDGPAGAGKSTVAKTVAQHLGGMLLDTGAIYRALALLATQRRIAIDDADALTRLAANMPLEFHPTPLGNTILLGKDDITKAIRTPDISRMASQISRIPAVRTALLSLQRRFANEGEGIVVAEGRDTGTVVFPHAHVKIFLYADPRVRAKRRVDELRAAGQYVKLEEILAAQRDRDTADTARIVAPLRPARDSIQIDTTELNINEVVKKIAAYCQPFLPKDAINS